MNGNGSEFRTPLKQARGLGSAKDGTGHFLWQRVTAIAVVLAGAWLLGLLLDACPPPDGAEVAAIAREGVQMVLGQVLAAAS